ncbi:MAG TPA: UvrD-helicase domain-containing protein [Thermoanaerobaculia bacterium]|jgi:ATP-dependent helicase/nuclease subunit A|nr:UvrD-helicase domain-containing protein [Thermoanaerobaculia bacterium]
MSGRVLVGAFGSRRDEDFLREADREARREAQRRFDRPLVLEAGAGTGKTTTLIGRLLAWTLGVGWERKEEILAKRAAEMGRPAPGPDRVAAAVLGGVVAITFTEAAAAEMASRAARELGALARGDEPPAWLDPAVLPPAEERARRARALAATLDHLAIRTIHAFCRGLLADHPLEARLHPDLQVDADGLLLEGVVQESVESSLREGYGDPGDPHLLALAARGFGPREVAEALIALVQKGMPSEALQDDPLAPEWIEELRRRLILAAEAAHDLIAPLLISVKLPNAKKIEEQLAKLAGRLLEAPVSLESLQKTAAELLPSNLVEHLKKWGRGTFNNATESRILGESREVLMPLASHLGRLLDHIADLDPVLLEHARLALAPRLAEIERTLRARGIATFDSLLTGAERLLARHSEVRARVRRGIDQLLVDEFQDTDRVQCEILRWLALDGPPEARPGLFLVGDPKQSIYGWRSADLRAYDGFLERVRQGWGEVRPLVENFRSVPAILEEVARTIEPVMRERHGLQPKFEPLLPCDRRKAETGFVGETWAPVEHWVSWSRDDRWQTLAVEATELEAAAVAADLVALHARGEAWGDMAILLRGMSQLDLYLEALRRAGVPFAVGRDKHYYRRREVIDAAALVRSVLDPGDHLALLTVLRSPSVGVPDAALIPLWSRKFPKRMTELLSPAGLAGLAELIDESAAEVPAGIPGMVAGWEASLKAAVEALAELRHSFSTDPADLFLEKLRGLLLVDVTEAARYLGPYRLANLDRFFRQLLKAMEDGGGDAVAVLRSLRRSVAEAREAEEGRPQDGAEDAVQVMTIHGAKGLDFKHVYLVQLHKQSGGESGPRTEAGRVEEGWEYRLLGAPTLAFDRVDAENREVEAAERVRTLYVAMTRAKDRLVLAGVWPGDADPRPPEQARSHLDLLLWRPGRPELAALWEQEAWSSPDRAGALWKLLALRPEAGSRDAGAEESVALPSAAEVARESEILAARRAEAEDRMSRRFSGAASEDSHDLLREQQAGRRTGEERSRGVDRDVAMAAGGAIHRALETWDLAADPGSETERQRGLLPSYLGTLAEVDVAARALPLAAELLDGFAKGPLLARLRGLREHVLARELPVLLPPSGGAVGVVSGTIDLLYRDPATGRLVVADYKTDDLSAVEARVAVYAPQGGVYVRALREALDLPEDPRFELWFLRAERVVDVRPPS